MLRAIMDISARAFSLPDRPRTCHLGHQGSQAPGRPVLHFVSSSRRPRRETGLCHRSLLIAVPLFVLEAVPSFSNRRPKSKRLIQFFCSTAPQAFFRPDRRLARPPRAARSMTAPLWGRPEGLSLTAASTVAGLVVAGLGSVRGSMAPRRLADRCRCQVHRSLRGPAALAAPWPQGFDAAMSRTRSARLAQEESRGRRGPSRQGQLPLLQQRTSFN